MLRAYDLTSHSPLHLERRRCFGAMPCFLFYHFNNKTYPSLLLVVFLLQTNKEYKKNLEWLCPPDRPPG